MCVCVVITMDWLSVGVCFRCGIRGGYMETIGFDKPLLDQVYKFCSTRLCANSVGQIVADVMVRPPQRREPSYQLFEKVTHSQSGHRTRLS